MIDDKTALCECGCGKIFKCTHINDLIRKDGKEQKSCGNCNNQHDHSGETIKVNIDGNEKEIKVLEKLTRKCGTNIYYKCLCHCGEKFECLYGDFKKIKSCGCLHNYENQEIKVKIKNGYKVIKILDKTDLKSTDGNTIYNCQCWCGEKFKTYIKAIKQGRNRSCGCLRKGVNSHLYKNYNQENIESSRKMRVIFSSFKNRPNLEKDSNIDINFGYSGIEFCNHMINCNLDWKNTKSYHIDHIFPIKAFIENNIFDLKIIFSLDNLQVLSKEDNLKKKDKYNKLQFYEKYSEILNETIFYRYFP